MCSTKLQTFDLHEQRKGLRVTLALRVISHYIARPNLDPLCSQNLIGRELKIGTLDFTLCPKSLSALQNAYMTTLLESLMPRMWNLELELEVVFFTSAFSTLLTC